jgi:hypothetical protein
MYVAVAVGPLGWHGGRGESPYFAGLDALFWVDRLDGGGLSSRSCREREGLSMTMSSGCCDDMPRGELPAVAQQGPEHVDESTGER